MKLTIVILFAASTLCAQTFTVEKVLGNAAYRDNGSEEWFELVKGNKINDEATISTGEKSSLQIQSGNLRFDLAELSAVSVGSIKKMSVDDLLLALALEDVLDAPKNIEKSSDNTAVYGTKEGEANSVHIKSDDFGIKRLNGAVQLAETGFEESAVVTAKETFRKYPDTKKLTGYRIYFANILYDKGLYEEAMEEYTSISKLSVTEEQKIEMEQKLESIRNKLLSN